MEPEVISVCPACESPNYSRHTYLCIDPGYEFECNDCGHTFDLPGCGNNED